MSAVFSDKTLHLILPSIVARVVAAIARREHISKLEALGRFYSSDTYKSLEKEQTKFWQLGCVALCEEYEASQSANRNQ
ncbi:MAG: hypothetical protein ACRC46_12840 [Thermoguttaceae bacterium]